MIPHRYPRHSGKSRRPRLLHVEQCESRFCLSAIGFSAHDIIKSDVIDPSDVQAADIDGDGDLDVVSASSGDDKIAWYENTDGAGNFGPQQVISTDADSPQSVAVGDLDGDGDLDVLSGGEGKIAWYENTDGAGNFGPQQVISTETAMSLEVADLDGDGDLDVLVGHSTLASTGTRTPTVPATLDHISRSAEARASRSVIWTATATWTSSLGRLSRQGRLVREHRWGRQLWIAASDHHRR